MTAATIARSSPVSGYITKSLKAPKGLRIISINNIMELPKAMFME